MVNFVPILLLGALLYFALIRPIRRRAAASGSTFLQAIPPRTLIIVGLILIGYGVVGNIAANDPKALAQSHMDPNSARSFFMYGGIAAGVLGSISVLVGLLKGVLK